MFQKIENSLLGLIEKLENLKITPVVWIISFLAVVFLRVALDSSYGSFDALSPKHWEFFFFQDPSSYLFAILFIILTVYLFTKERIEKITKIALFGTFVLLLAPPLDMFFRTITGQGISGPFFGPCYHFLSSGQNLLFLFWNYLTFGTSFLFQDIHHIPSWLSIFHHCLRIGIMILIFLLLRYVFLKTRSILKTSLVFSAFLLLSYCIFLIAFKDTLINLSSYTFNEFGTIFEGIVVGIICFGYILFKTKNILKAFLFIFALRIFAFIFGFFPSIFATLFGFPASIASFHNVSNLDLSFSWSRILFCLFFILILGMACLWFFIYNKDKFIAFLKNIRLTRAGHNFAMLGFGLFIGGLFSQNLNSFDWLLIMTAGLSLLLFWISAVCQNDLQDWKIDRISNPQRPLPQSKFSKEEFKSINHILTAASCLSALVVNYMFFVLILLKFSLAHIYSNPPFRLRRFPVLATFLSALGVLFTIFGGFILINQTSILDFPIKLIWFVLIVFTFGSMVKDIKDFEGDKKEGIYTIPVIFGLKKGKLILAIVAFLIFLSFPFVFSQFFRILILPSILAGILSFWLINRKKYTEKPLFLIYFAYGLFFTFTVF